MAAATCNCEPRVSVAVVIGGALILVGTMVSAFQLAPAYKRLGIAEPAGALGTTLIGLGTVVAFADPFADFIGQEDAHLLGAVSVLVLLSLTAVALGVTPSVVRRRKASDNQGAKPRDKSNESH